MSNTVGDNDLIERRIALVKSNFKNLTSDKATFAASFYERLFGMAPQLKPLFMGTPMHKQGAKMHAALVLLVENLRNPESLREVLGPLGERHKTYGATAQSYEMFGAALIGTLKEYSSGDWTEEVEEAWTATNEMVISLMLEGAGVKIDTPIEIAKVSEKTPASAFATTSTSTETDPLERQIALVKSNFKNLKADKTEFADSFYTRLFKTSPQLEPLFEGTPMKSQGAKLHAALVLLVENLRNPDALQQVLGPLGAKHKGYGATPQTYPMIGAALLETLEEYSEGDWTEEVKDAWDETFTTVTGIMLAGAGMKAIRKQNTLIANTDCDLIQASFVKIKEAKEAFSGRFYTNLMEVGPELEPFFRGLDMTEFSKRHFEGLENIVKNLPNSAKLEKTLLSMGKQHVSYGAVPEQYDIVGQAYLKTLEDYIGDDWTDDVRLAWERAFSAISKIMLKGAGEAAPPSAKSIKAPVKAKSKVAITAAQKTKLKHETKPDPLTSRFFTMPVWKIIAIGVCVALVLIPMGKVYPPIKDFTDFAEPLSIFIALLLFIREMPERKKQFHYQAWGAIDAAQGIKSSHARFIALQDLCDDGVSLKGLHLDGAELAGIEMNGVDLSGSSLCEATLSNASLRAANLNHADFSRAIMTGGKFDGTNSSFVKFVEANLSSADFSEANMIFADLTKANLSGINFTNAKLNGAKFEGAYMSGADLRGADISIDDLAGAFLTGAIMPDGTVHP